jgi:hypothetical protein
MDAKTAYEQFKAAVSDGKMTNGQIVTQVNKLYEKMRLAKLAGDAAVEKAKNAELVAENARLRQQLEGKQKATGKAA